MIVEYYSDIHFEFRRDKHPWEPDNLQFEDKSDRVLVLAGDIGAESDIQLCVKFYSMFYGAVIFVPGNHEYYGTEFNSQREKYLHMFDGIDNIHVLEKSGVMLDDVLFLGGTLWTDFHGDKQACMDPYLYMRRLADFRAIKFNDLERGFPRLLWPEDMVREYQETVRYFNQTLQASSSLARKKVVISHFPPSQDCRDKSKYPFVDDIGKYFYPNVPEKVVGMADYWIYGHSHDDIRLEKEGCKIVSNQIGYPNERGNINYKKDNFLIL